MQVVSARKRADAAWSSQGALSCDGMANATLGNVETTEDNIADVFALWVERIADCHEAVRQLSL